MRDIRAKYQAHVAAILKLAGFSDSEARAARIVALEHAIAEKHTSSPTMKTSSRPTTPGSNPISPSRRRAWIGLSTSTPPVSASR